MKGKRHIMIVVKAELVNKKSTIHILPKNRGIKYFVHFTRISNLQNILSNGIVPRNELPPGAKVNDLSRFDGRTNTVSLSISFPNYKTFYKFRNDYPNEKWCVILLDADKVANLDCAYFCDNAAAKEMSSSDWNEKTTYEAFNALFEGRRSNYIPDSYPSNPQAEVMVRGKIPATCIKKIVFNEKPNNYKISTRIPMEWDSSFFLPRKDHNYWKY